MLRLSSWEKPWSAGEDPVIGFNVVKGFLNLEIEAAYWSQWLMGEAAEADYGQKPAAAHLG